MGLSAKELARLRLNEMGFIFQQMYMMNNLTILDNIVLPAMESKKTSESRKEKIMRGEDLMRKLDIIRVAARCSRVLYLVDGNIKGEYKSPAGSDVKEKDRERMLNNWLMELGW